MITGFFFPPLKNSKYVFFIAISELVTLATLVLCCWLKERMKYGKTKPKKGTRKTVRKGTKPKVKRKRTLRI
jgi:hypothetical protein